jgi:hypothetical protein
MMWFWFIIASFATYYTALSIAEQDGPFGVFDKVRARFDTGYLGKGLRCVVCVSAYTGAAWALFLALFGLYDVWLWPIVAFGLAGASVFVNKVWKR